MQMRFADQTYATNRYNSIELYPGGLKYQRKSTSIFNSKRLCGHLNGEFVFF
jgi:hypothetical protein